MDGQRGDDYLRNISSFIRANESRLAEAAFQRRRRSPKSRQATSSSLSLNPLQWFSSDSTTRPKPLMFSIDTHHLFYILTRIEALGHNIGSLDVKVDNPSRPMNYIDVFQGEDTSDTMSLTSIRTSLSTISGLSLGRSLWGRTEPPNVDQELKYIFSSFTKIPAVSLRAPGPKQIAEIAGDPPNENALPLDAFRNLQSLECIDIDPRTLLGWDRLSESLWSLTIIRGGLDDLSHLFIDAVSDDAARRQASRDSRPNGLSRQSSFHGTRLPESIAEHADETIITPINDDITPATSPSDSSTSAQLPQSKWAFLRFLSLCDNALTFVPTECLFHLTSLTHLDLSSNLLVSIPDGLSSLYNLVSLNLSHNMIDTVHGVYKKLGQVLSLNLAHNRLDSLGGLERLVALEHVNVGHNRLEESGEVGRLALLPNVARVDVEGNPFTEIESDYRIKCFDFFWKEGRAILLDGTQAGFYEKTYLTSPPPEQMTSTRPLSKAYSPPVVPVGVTAAATTMTVPATTSSGVSPSSSPPFSPSSSHHPSPLLSAAANAKPRKKRVKRIVDLDADTGGNAPRSEETSEHSRAPTVLTRSPRAEPTLLPSTSESGPGLAPAIATVPSMEGATPPGPAVRPPRLDTSPPFKHRRSHTEFAPASATAESDDVPSPLLVSRQDPERTMSVRVTGRRAAMRRGRVSASVYEAPSPKEDKVEEGMEREIKEADAYRARIEALRSEMGDGWLKVFSQSNAVVTRPTAELPG